MHHVIEHELPEMKKYFGKKVIANVSGFSVDDYAYQRFTDKSTI